MISNTRLYGASIAFASGLYSLWSASMSTRMGAGGWLMLVVGAVVLAHGAVLLTDYANRLGSASGPLMIAYSILMLLNQALLGTGMMGGMGSVSTDGMGTGSMDGGMMSGGQMGGSAISAGMGWDAGMVFLALLMLVSGVIMTRDGDSVVDLPTVVDRECDRLDVEGLRFLLERESGATRQRRIRDERGIDALCRDLLIDEHEV